MGGKRDNTFEVYSRWITYEDPSNIVELLRIQVILSYLFERAPLGEAVFSSGKPSKWSMQSSHKK